MTENDRHDNQGEEDGEYQHVHDGIFEDDIPTLLLLLQRVQWCTDLFRRAEPEKHGRVQPVGVRDQDGRREHEQQNVSQQDITTPETHLDDLDDEFTSGLRHDMVAETTAGPFTSPPGQVGLVVLELSGEEHGNENLVDGALDGDDGDQSEDGV